MAKLKLVNAPHVCLDGEVLCFSCIAGRICAGEEAANWFPTQRLNPYACSNDDIVKTQCDDCYEDINVLKFEAEQSYNRADGIDVSFSSQFTFDSEGKQITYLQLTYDT